MHQRPAVRTAIAVDVSAWVSKLSVAAGRWLVEMRRGEKWILITGQVRRLAFCIVGVELHSLKRTPFDGKSLLDARSVQ